jgi:hypothetical protein
MIGAGAKILGKIELTVIAGAKILGKTAQTSTPKFND